jgi:ribosomal protein S12 methylthiotransferase
MSVLIDGHEGSTAIARSAADAPEIDGTVRIAHGGKLAAGSFARVRVTAASEHDLDARLAD